jgi:hypothetical protein
LTDPASPFTDEIIYQLMGNREDKDPWASVCMDLLDSGNVATQIVAINKLYPDDFGHKKVQKGLNKKFFGETDSSVKKLILQKWMNHEISEYSSNQLSENIKPYEEFAYEITELYYQIDIGDSIVTNIIQQIDQLASNNRKAFIDMLKSKKGDLSKQSWKKVKKLK